MLDELASRAHLEEDPSRLPIDDEQELGSVEEVRARNRHNALADIELSFGGTAASLEAEGGGDSDAEKEGGELQALHGFAPPAAEARHAELPDIEPSPAHTEAVAAAVQTTQAPAAQPVESEAAAEAAEAPAEKADEKADDGDSEPEQATMKVAEGGHADGPAQDGETVANPGEVMSGAAEGLDQAATKAAEIKAAPAPAPAAPQVEANPKAEKDEGAPTAPEAKHAEAGEEKQAPKAGADSFAGADTAKGKMKDRWAKYQDSHGWDIGGNQTVRHSGGDVSAAIYAVSNVEGRYDSVQTYDAGILSFGIMQWTLHAGSLQGFLGFLRDKSGPEGKAAFQQHFAANSIDVSPQGGGRYGLLFEGKSYPTKEEIDKLVRSNPDTARKWATVFHNAGRDARVQRAQFEKAKAEFHEAQAIKFGPKAVADAKKRCPKTFFAKYPGEYGQANNWTSASSKAATLYFSMRINNPAYGNAALLKAIDAFLDANGTDRTKWPANWGNQFGDFVEAKCKETLSTWTNQVKKGELREGRVEKTLRHWNQVHGKEGAAPVTSTAATTTAPVTKTPTPTPHSAEPKAPSHHEEAAKSSGPKESPDRIQRLLRGEYRGLLKLYVAGKINESQAIQKMIAYDQKLHGGTVSVDGVVLMTTLIVDMTKIAIERAKKKSQATATASKTTSSTTSSTTTTGSGTHQPPPIASTEDDSKPLPPGAISDLQDKRLAREIAALNNEQVNEVAREISALEKHPKAQGEERDQVVAGVAKARKKIDALPGGPVAKVKAGLYRAVQNLSGSYDQDTNIDVLEGKAQAKRLGVKTQFNTRTCNITSLSMALESLGKTAENYSGDRNKILAIARFWSPQVASAQDSVHKGGGDWGEVAGLRLPDFMEMAVIAEFMDRADEDVVEKATKQAWGKILVHDFLAQMAGHFGVSGEVRALKGSSRAVGNKNRSAVEKHTDSRNAASGAKKDEFERTLRETTGITDDEVDTFKANVQKTIGAELDAGNAMVVGLSGHFVRMQGLTDEFVIVDDPGRKSRADRKVTYAEAYAMGYFSSRITLKG